MKERNERLSRGECPACGDMLPLGARPRYGQRVVCRHCDAPLIVISKSPLELDWADEDVRPKNRRPARPHRQSADPWDEPY